MEKVKDTIVTATKADERKPDLNEDWFADADAFIGTKLVRRGRPKAGKVKRPVSLRLDEDVIDWFKKGGPGWQTRMNDALREVLSKEQSSNKLVLSAQEKSGTVDNLQNRGPADRSRINVNETWEIRWWTQELGVSEEQLREAVTAVGVSAATVRRHLGR